MTRESKKALTERIHGEYALLCEEIPDPKSALNFTNPFQLLVATVLSAQCTDARVNKVTPDLFAAYPTAHELALANETDVQNIIHSLGFFRTKAANIIRLSAAIEDDFDGQVPSTMEELVTLPGVGRKTANVVLGNAFDKPGFPVDTHVIRVTGRLHWRHDWKSKKPDPVKIEQEITRYFPPDEWADLSHRLILHGRAVCVARKPHCAECPLNGTCPSAPTFLSEE